MKKLILTVALAVLSAPAVAAQPAKAPAKPAAPQQVTRADAEKRFAANFAHMDSNKDGSLDQAEIDAARASYIAMTKKIMAAQIAQEFKATDTDKDGQASLEEMTAVAPAQARAGIPKVIEKLDTNKDQKLSEAEFAAAAGEPDVTDVADTSDFLTRFDGNKDGKVTGAEYAAPGLAAFDRIDANKDGKVTAAERDKLRSAPEGR